MVKYILMPETTIQKIRKGDNSIRRSNNIPCNVVGWG